jgi:protein TonB
VDDWAATIEQFRQREYRRLVGISAAFHGVVLLFLIWNPIPRPPAALPGVVAVRFVSLPSAGPAAPEAEAAPPKPIPPVAKKVVLPAEPKKLEEPKPKPEVKKVEPKPEPRKAEPKPEVKKPEMAQFDVEDIRKELGDTARPPAAATATVPGPATGMPGSATGVPLSDEERAWYQRAKIHLSREWKLEPGFRGQALSTLVRVELDAQGNVLGEPKKEKGSGNPWYDDSAMRAVSRASPLPPPPAAGEYVIEFIPEI